MSIHNNSTKTLGILKMVIIAVIGVIILINLLTQPSSYSQSNEDIYQVAKTLITSSMDIPEAKMAPIENHYFISKYGKVDTLASNTTTPDEICFFKDFGNNPYLISSYVEYLDNQNEPVRKRFTYTLTHQDDDKWVLSKIHNKKLTKNAPGTRQGLIKDSKATVVCSFMKQNYFNQDKLTITLPYYLFGKNISKSSLSNFQLLYFQ